MKTTFTAMTLILTVIMLSHRAEVYAQDSRDAANAYVGAKQCVKETIGVAS